MLFSEMNPAHHGWDGAIYTAVGRGIINGLIPYQDLFEPKPPLMFLISAVSLYFTNGIGLANALQGMVEVGILAAVFIPAFQHRENRLSVILCACLFGTLLIGYTIERSGHFQSESFGSFFLIGYLALLLTWKNSLFRIIGAAICLAMAIGTKEPFLIIAFAVCLLLIEHPGEFLKKFIYPLLIALIGGAGVLLFLDYFGPYVSIYLPELLNGRASYVQVPAWYYSFLISYPLKDIWQFSPTLMVAVVAAWLLSLPPSMRQYVAIGCFVLLLTLYGAVIRLFEGTPGVQTLFLIIGLICVIGYWITAHWWLRSYELLSSSIRHIIPIVCMLFVMGSAGFLTQHYGFGIPIYVTLFILTINRYHKNVTVLYVLSSLCAVGVAFLPIHALNDLSERIKIDAQRKEYAQTIDGLMDSCGYDRYLIAGAYDVPYEHTKHSPVGPGFHRAEFSIATDWRAAPIPYLLETFDANLHQAEFVIAPADLQLPFTDEQNIYILGQFTKDTPSCAQYFTSKSNHIFLYKKV